jgi:predicted transcriptional regulator
MNENAQASKAERNTAITRAHPEYGYTLSEIAQQVGLHYTTISKIVEKRLKTL